MRQFPTYHFKMQQPNSHDNLYSQGLLLNLSQLGQAWSEQGTHSLNLIILPQREKAPHRQCLTFRQLEQKSIFINSFRIRQKGTLRISTQRGKRRLRPEQETGTRDPIHSHWFSTSTHNCIQNLLWLSPKLHQILDITTNTTGKFKQICFVAMDRIFPPLVTEF